MTSNKFIGAIDLSVRLSSMNPLGHLDLSASTVTFERSILQALEVVWQRARNQVLLDEGVIKGGDIPKGFELEEAEDLIEFVSSLRWKLLEARLPFKICTRVGVGVGITLADRWTAVVHALRTGGTQRETLKAEISEAKRRLGTLDPDVLERYFKLHRPLASTDNTADLQRDLESFKGLGFHADVDFHKFVPDAMKSRFFVNYFPNKTGKSFLPCAFIDLYWPFSPFDLISRYVGSSQTGAEDSLDVGSKSIISNVFDMLRRSIKASESNGIFYVSLLNAFIMSSNFSRVMYINRSSSKLKDRQTAQSADKDVFVLADLMAGDPINLVDPTDPELQYANGWQNYPPIFRAVLLDSDCIKLLKKSPGSEIVLASLLNCVWDRQVETDLIEIAVDSSISQALNDASGSEESEKVDGSLEYQEEDDKPVDVLFERLVREIQARYGEVMIRKIFGLSDQIIGIEAKKSALRASTSTSS